jgi:hypothetical protein
MFKHRFNPETAADFTSVINAVSMMIGRAKSSLMMTTTYLEGNCDDLHNQDVATVLYGVLAELEDVDEVLDAHHKANFKLQEQVDALSYFILIEKILTPEKLKLILDVATLPIAAQVEVVEQIRQTLEPEPENKTIH